MKEQFKSLLQGSVLISVLTIGSVVFFAAVIVLQSEPTPIGNCYSPTDGCQQLSVVGNIEGIEL